MEGIISPSQGLFPNNPTQARKKLGLEIDLKIDYGASGSNQNTTGTIPAGSNILSLTAPIDFINGQGISIAGAGPGPFQTDGVTPLTAPVSLTATPTGTTGSTAYTYWCAAIDVQYGITLAVSGTTSTGNATLSSTNYNALTVPAVTKPAGYMWWGDASNPAKSQGLLGITASNSFNDVGYGTLEYLSAGGSVAPYLPLTVPASAIGDTLITKINAGGGTHTLTLADQATNSVTGAYVGHSDYQVFVQFVNDCVAQNRVGYIPNANYILDKPLVFNWSQTVNGLKIYSEQANLWIYPPVGTATVGNASKNVFILYAGGGFMGLTLTDINLRMYCRTGGFIIPAASHQPNQYPNIRMRVYNLAGQAANLQYIRYANLNTYTQGTYSPDTGECSGLVLASAAYSSLIVNSLSGNNVGTIVGSHALILDSSNNNTFSNGLLTEVAGVNSDLYTSSISEGNVFNGFSFDKLLSASLGGTGNVIIGSTISTLDTIPNPAVMSIIGGLYDNTTQALGQTAVNTELTTTSATNVLTYTVPAFNQALTAYLTLGIITAATTVTATLTWTDPNAGAQTYTWENAASLGVGTKPEVPVSILASASSTVTLTVTAGTANQVFVTASINKQV